MEKPLCPICKVRHYPREEHVWAKDVSAAPVVRLRGFDRGRYQREYMKLWRALKSGRAQAWPRCGKT